MSEKTDEIKQRLTLVSRVKDHPGKYIFLGLTFALLVFAALMRARGQ